MAADLQEDAEIREALTSLAKAAARCPYVIARFACDDPTAWDRRHADIDALLDVIT